VAEDEEQSVNKGRLPWGWLARRWVALAVAGAIVLLLGLGIGAAVLTSGSSQRRTAVEKASCTTAGQALQEVRQPLQQGDIQGTIQAAQNVLPRVEALTRERGISSGLVRVLDNLAGALQATSNGSAASLPGAGNQLRAACPS
jgi:hypothetical protein